MKLEESVSNSHLTKQLPRSKENLAAILMFQKKKKKDEIAMTMIFFNYFFS